MIFITKLKGWLVGAGEQCQWLGTGTLFLWVTLPLAPVRSGSIMNWKGLSFPDFTSPVKTQSQHCLRLNKQMNKTLRFNVNNVVTASSWNFTLK